MYPMASEGISKCRYRDLLRSLSANTSDMPLEPSDPQKHFMEDVSRICRTIAFVKNKSILSFDDDHLRLRSHGVEDAGFVRIRNPKAFGPVFHAIISMGTGLFQGGHIARRNESNTDCAKHCLMSLDHQRLEKNLELKQIFACDRGYSSKELTEFFIDSKLTLIGTTKRHQKQSFRLWWHSESKVELMCT